jgi:hypothetical protein
MCLFRVISFRGKDNKNVEKDNPIFRKQGAMFYKPEQIPEGLTFEVELSGLIK